MVLDLRCMIQRTVPVILIRPLVQETAGVGDHWVSMTTLSRTHLLSLISTCHERWPLKKEEDCLWLVEGMVLLARYYCMLKWCQRQSTVNKLHINFESGFMNILQYICMYSFIMYIHVHVYHHDIKNV